MTVLQALVRNMGTYRSDVKGESQVARATRHSFGIRYAVFPGTYGNGVSLMTSASAAEIVNVAGSTTSNALEKVKSAACYSTLTNALGVGRS